MTKHLSRQSSLTLGLLNHEFLDSIKNKDVKKINELIREGFSIRNPINKKDISPLECLIQCVDYDSRFMNTLAIIEPGFWNYEDSVNGNTALHFAIKHNNLLILQSFLKIKSLRAKLNQKNKEGTTPLQLACNLNNFIIVQELIAAGVELSSTDNLGLTPLHYATKNQDIDLATLLLEHGASVDHQGSSVYQYGPVHFAASHGNIDFLKLLYKYAANLDILNYNNETALYLAVSKGYINAASFLLEHQANVNTLAKKEQMSPLYLAVKSDNYNMVSLLLCYQADPNLLGTRRKTILDSLLSRSPEAQDMINLLREYGALTIQELIENNELEYPEETSPGPRNRVLSSPVIFSHPDSPITTIYKYQL
jgi:ankyrin repeat protein